MRALLEPEQTKAWHRSYNEGCNAHRFDEMSTFGAFPRPAAR